MNNTHRALNFIRAYMSNENIKENGISYDIINKVSKDKTVSKQSSDRILDLEKQVRKQVEEQRQILIRESKDNTKNPFARRLAKLNAESLTKQTFTDKEVKTRQEVIKESVLPTTDVQKYLSNYTELKNDKLTARELERFVDAKGKGQTTFYKDTVFFNTTNKKIKSTSRVNPRAIVYMNIFNTGYTQIVRDFNATFYGENLTLAEANRQGLSYFNSIFPGNNHTDVNVSNMDLGISKPKGAKIKTRGERYESLKPHLAERRYVGIYL